MFHCVLRKKLTHIQEFPFSPWCDSIINVLHTAVWCYSSGNVRVISVAHGGLIPILRHSEELKPLMAWNANANVLKMLMPWLCSWNPSGYRKNIQLIWNTHIRTFSLKYCSDSITHFTVLPSVYCSFLCFLSYICSGSAHLTLIISLFNGKLLSKTYNILFYKTWI